MRMTKKGKRGYNITLYLSNRKLIFRCTEKVFYCLNSIIINIIIIVIINFDICTLLLIEQKGDNVQPELVDY